MKDSKVLLIVFISLVLMSCSENTSSEKENIPDSQRSAYKKNVGDSSIEIIRKQDLDFLVIEDKNDNYSIPITGRVIPKNTSEIYSEVQGLVMSSRKPFKPGITYKKGELILNINSEEFENQLKAEKSSFLGLISSILPDLKSDYPEGYDNWSLYLENYNIESEIDDIPAFSTNSEKYFLTSRQVYNTYFIIKSLEDRLEKYNIRAPFDGLLSQANTDIGSLVSPGQFLGKFVSTKFEIEAAVSINQLNAIKIDDGVEFENKKLGQRFKAKVSRINSILDVTTQNVPIYLDIEEPSLLSGIYVEGLLPSNKFSNSFKIPSNLLRRDNSLMILKSNVLKRKEVEVIEIEGDKAFVSGLQAGDTLVINDFVNPVSGLKIEN